MYMYMYVRCMSIEVQVLVHVHHPLGIRTLNWGTQTDAMGVFIVFIKFKDQARNFEGSSTREAHFEVTYWHCFRPEDAPAPFSGGLSDMLPILL